MNAPVGFCKSLFPIICMALLLTGCRSVNIPQTGYVSPEEQGAMTIGLDDHDYDLVAEGISREMFMRGLPKTYVVVLGPVDTRECPYDVRVVQLQKSLQVIFNREGTLKFLTVADAMSGGTAIDEIFKIIQYNWLNSNPMDLEDLQTFGKLAQINGILFGRVSSLERNLPGGAREISYRFVWELTNTETGLLDISHEQRIRKNVSRDMLLRQ
ncbi:MAG: hypothetical protein ABR497_02705 [Kiritimatiellia bacterium]